MYKNRIFEFLTSFLHLEDINNFLRPFFAPSLFVTFEIIIIKFFKMPKILTTSQIRLADEYTILNEPINSLDLMERASGKLFEWVQNNFPVSREIYVFSGPGNNGGDGLALARMLRIAGFKVHVFILKISKILSKDAEINLERYEKLGNNLIQWIEDLRQFPVISKGALIIDALFGSGLKRPLEGLAAELVKHLNDSKEEILAIDIPSGLFGEDNRENNTVAIIRAKTTLTFECPKLAFFFAENHPFVGSWHVLPIGLQKEFIQRQESNRFYATRKEIQGLLKNRQKFDHKGRFGHALLLAGSRGKTGAAVLSARACLKTGCGLLTVHLPASGYEIFQSALPEAMCSIDSKDDVISNLPDLGPYNALGIGPGIGTRSATSTLVRSLLKTTLPLVIDADAVNILAENQPWLNDLSENIILTPHPGEFDRLAGKSGSGFERFLKQIDFAIRYKAIVVLKGAFTSVVSPDGIAWFNTTGNPGMATAGSGDVLTGIILSLLAQGYTPLQAARVGVFLHGLAGDLALVDQSFESLIAGNIIDHIGIAFNNLQKTLK
jgi:ADP-dependent NAD(P)H-hydrate dehydratase / NAD(P)H-hydrate epimerase